MTKKVISDAHKGLKAAVEAVLTGASWQRCRVHFMRNVLAHIPRETRPVVAAGVRTIFAQPNCEAAGQQLERALIQTSSIVICYTRKQVRSRE